ncbi:MAG: hypothetical protein WA510_04995 [Acidobacteriaceae bacterium]
MATGFQVEFIVEASRFPGLCKDVSDEGIRAEFDDLLIEGSSGLLILRPRNGVLELRSQVAYVEKRQVGLLFLFETSWERRMTVDFITGIRNDTGPSSLMSIP